MKGRALRFADVRQVPRPNAVTYVVTMLLSNHGLAMDSGNGGRPKEKLGVKQIVKWSSSQERRAGHKLADGGGLYLTILPSGRATWQVRFFQGGKARTFSIGPAENVSLAQARSARIKIRSQVDAGVDPLLERVMKRVEAVEASANTFNQVASEWLDKQKAVWSQIHFVKSQRALARDVLPTLGKLPVHRITTAMVAATIDVIQKRGVRDTTQKILQHVRSIFRYAQAKGCVQTILPNR